MTYVVLYKWNHISNAALEVTLNDCDSVCMFIGGRITYGYDYVFLIQNLVTIVMFYRRFLLRVICTKIWHCNTFSNHASHREFDIDERVVVANEWWYNGHKDVNISIEVSYPLSRVLLCVSGRLRILLISNDNIAETFYTADCVCTYVTVIIL